MDYINYYAVLYNEVSANTGGSGDVADIATKCFLIGVLAAHPIEDLGMDPDVFHDAIIDRANQLRFSQQAQADAHSGE